MVVSINWGPFLWIIRALPFGVHIRATDFLNSHIPQLQMAHVLRQSRVRIRKPRSALNSLPRHYLEIYGT